MTYSTSDLRDGIIATATALGMNPHTLATFISYETSGTFDPLKRGPTTRWGQHRGLIQFGEPQAAQFGVDWSNPLASQLGPNGAIARYFRAHGWEPGMSDEQAYAIINGGNPRALNASDAASGGAPGTVRDKVRFQMEGHRAKAAALLGSSYSPVSASMSTYPTSRESADTPSVDPSLQDPAPISPYAQLASSYSSYSPVSSSPRPRNAFQALASAYLS